MPTTFVDVPVDTVTAYLDPILSPDCVDNGHPTQIGSGGGSTIVGSTISGELVWPGQVEFKIAPWDVPVPPNLVPDASNGIRLAAYVFPLASDLSQPFRLPKESSATTPANTGSTGYTFTTTAGLGNVTLYALAGVENRAVNPPSFTAYTLGIAPGVSGRPGTQTDEVFIPMNIPLDHAFTIDVNGPQATTRGPDRLSARVGVRVGNLGYVTLPVGSATALLPVAAPLSFVGLPPLVHGLLGAQYVTTATAATGESLSLPKSVLGLFATTDPLGPARLDGFVEVPHLDVPGTNGAWDGQHLSVSTAPGGPEPDMTMFEIQSGGGLSTWTVVAPRGVTSVALPDLSTVDALGSSPGPLTITVTLAVINAFDYGSLRYVNLATRGWNAYATDTFHAYR
jgi:hypothetical protein